MRITGISLFEAKVLARAWNATKPPTGQPCEEGYTEAVAKWISAGWNFATVTDIPIINQLVNIRNGGQPLSLNMPHRNNPKFAECKSCSDETDRSNSMKFVNFQGMGAWPD